VLTMLASTNQQTQPGVAKTLTKLLAVSSNRSCADCRSTLVDSSRIFASVCPSQHTKLSTVVSDPASLAASVVTGGHGVFVCSRCAAAHKVLGASAAIVHSVQDVSSWTPEQVDSMVQGGNLQSWTVLEAFVPPLWKRPTPESSSADRLAFVRAKYDALAYILPQPGPLAYNAWNKIVDMHPEWRGLWDVNSCDFETPNNGANKSVGVTTTPTNIPNGRIRAIPDRLVNFFCVVTPADLIDPGQALSDLSKIRSPHDLLLVPQISECYPQPDTYDDGLCFPEHVSTFLFPEGCRVSTTALPPSFFTFVLTSANGDRLYGGALRLYDDGRDLLFLKRALENSGYSGKLPEWLANQNEKSAETATYGPASSAGRSNYSRFVSDEVVFLL
jgi:hypothetical protein